MKYKGIELKEVTKPQLFDPPKKMFVWDSYSNIVGLEVYAIVSRKDFPVICENSTWQHCAKIPEEPKPKLVTYRELSRWLAQGNGEMKFTTSPCTGSLCYAIANESEPVPPSYVVRKWDDTEWHKPTREYLGLEDK